MIAIFLRWLRRWKHKLADGRRLIELTEHRTMMIADLEKMRHWPEPVQARMQEQIDALERQIDAVRGRN